MDDNALLFSFVSRAFPRRGKAALFNLLETQPAVHTDQRCIIYEKMRIILFRQSSFLQKCGFQNMTIMELVLPSTGDSAPVLYYMNAQGKCSGQVQSIFISSSLTLRDNFRRMEL